MELLHGHAHDRQTHHMDATLLNYTRFIFNTIKKTGEHAISIRARFNNMHYKDTCSSWSHKSTCDS